MTAFQDGITQYNVIVGSSNKAVASVAPSATSGVPVISQGSSANPTFGTAVVAGGGTGVASFTAYSLVAAGTTSTGAMQSVGAGSSGQIIRSGGASALPAWSTATYPATAGTSGKVLISDGTNIVSSTPTFPNASATSGKVIKSDGTNWVASTETYAAPGASGNVLTSDGTNWTSAAPASGGTQNLQIAGASQITPADATTYYYGTAVSTTQTTANTKTVFSKSGTITACYVQWSATSSPSSESVSCYIRLNNTTDTTLTTSLNVSGGNGGFNATGLSIAVVAGDYIQFKVVTPTWGTNPGALTFSATAVL